MRKQSDDKSISPSLTALAKPDYAKWAGKGVWRTDEAACLLADIEPIAKKHIQGAMEFDRYHQFLERIEKSKGKDLKYFSFSSANEYLFLPQNVILWAEAADIQAPVDLISAVMESSPSGFRSGQFIEEIRTLKRQIIKLEGELIEQRQVALPDYMQPTHKYFSEELRTACDAWTNIFCSGNFDTHRGGKAQIATWLRKNKPQLSDFAQKRITTVVNPNKKGGLPKTP